jgi:Ca-activated chloride channel homolog
MKIGLFCVRLFAVLVFAISIFPQSKESTVRVSVTDNKFRSVKDLKKEDFILKENGVPQEITQFKSGEDEPLSVLILIDNSGSISQNTKQLQAKAALEFIQKSNVKNDYAIAEFGDTLRESADWGSTDNQLVTALNTMANNKNSLGGTLLYSALNWSVKKLEAAKYSQKVLLILSDGENYDEKNRYDFKDSLVKSNIVVYGVSAADYESGSNQINGQANLFELSRLSGGDSFFTQSMTEFSDVFEKIITENKSFYLLSYVPNKTVEKKDWQDISVTLSPKRKKTGKFSVRTQPKIYRAS